MIISHSFKQEEVVGFKFGSQPIGKPKLVSHIYFVDGLLIDTGQRKMRKYILSEIGKLNVRQMFVTHYHEDHTGNIEVLKALHGCKVYAPESCCEIMKNPPPLSLAQKLTWGSRASCQDLIPIYDVIKTPKFSFDMIPIPGHSPDMVALHEPNRKWLFSADLFINTYIGYFLKDESMKTQMESIRNVLQLDFEVLFCSHNPQLTNGKQQLVKKLHFFESFFNDVAVLSQKGYSPTEIFKALKLKENTLVKILSGGHLSKMNMVKAVLRDLEKE